jgi:hypothetical protein
MERCKSGLYTKGWDQGSRTAQIIWTYQPNIFPFENLYLPVSALHHLVTKIEKALRYKEVALSAFVDIQEEFENTGFEFIRAAAVRRKKDPESVEWIYRDARMPYSHRQNHQRLLPRRVIITSSVVPYYR